MNLSKQLQRLKEKSLRLLGSIIDEDQLWEKFTCQQFIARMILLLEV